MRYLPLLALFAMGTAAFASSHHVAAVPAPAVADGPAAADGFVDLVAGEDQTILNPGTGGMSLADALTLERKASVWWEYARDVSSVTARLTRAGHTTLFVPTDEAIMALPHKPHNNPSGGTSDSDAQRNVEAFLSAHIVAGDVEVGKAAETLGGTSVTVTEKDGDMRANDVKVVGVKPASNGMIYYLDGTLEY